MGNKVQLCYNKNIFTNEKEKKEAFNLILNHYKEKNLYTNITEYSELNLAKLIYSIKGTSCRYLSCLIFPNSKKQTQMHGRDIKRWAADQLNILEDAACDWAN